MKKIVLGALLCTVSIPSIADTGLFSGEVLFGHTNQMVKGDDIEESDDSELSFGLRAIYQFNNNMAFELSYMNYGDAEDSYVDSSSDTITVGISSTALQAGVRGIFPLTNQLSLNARVGISHLNAELQFEDSFTPNDVDKGKDSSSDIYYGIGARYTLNPQFFVGAEYTVSKHDLKIGELNDWRGENEVKAFSLVTGLTF